MARRSRPKPQARSAVSDRDSASKIGRLGDPKLGPTSKAQGVDAIITDLPAEMRAALVAPSKHD